MLNRSSRFIHTLRLRCLSHLHGCHLPFAGSVLHPLAWHQLNVGRAEQRADHPRHCQCGHYSIGKWRIFWASESHCFTDFVGCFHHFSTFPCCLVPATLRSYKGAEKKCKNYQLIKPWFLFRTCESLHPPWTRTPLSSAASSAVVALSGHCPNGCCTVTKSRTCANCFDLFFSHVGFASFWVKILFTTCFSVRCGVRLFAELLGVLRVRACALLCLCPFGLFHAAVSNIVAAIPDLLPCSNHNCHGFTDSRANPHHNAAYDRHWIQSAFSVESKADVGFLNQKLSIQLSFSVSSSRKTAEDRWLHWKNWKRKCHGQCPSSSLSSSWFSGWQLIFESEDIFHQFPGHCLFSSTFTRLSTGLTPSGLCSAFWSASQTLALSSTRQPIHWHILARPSFSRTGWRANCSRRSSMWWLQRWIN